METLPTLEGPGDEWYHDADGPDRGPSAQNPSHKIGRAASSRSVLPVTRGILERDYPIAVCKRGPSRARSYFANTYQNTVNRILSGDSIYLILALC
jgi:hypothetical protein